MTPFLPHLRSLTTVSDRGGRRGLFGLAIALGLLFAGWSEAEPSAAVAPLALPRPAAMCGGFGLSSPKVLEEAQALEARLGCRFESILWFQDWNSRFNLERAQAVVAHGAVPQISWQPRYVDRKGVLHGVPYREITEGKHDAYLLGFALGVRRLGTTVNIAFAPEMNGDWGAYQLSETNTAADFIAAYRYIVELFRRYRAPARFIWAPNIMYYGQKASLAEVFPGDEYVDILGLDGYNWGTTTAYHAWQSFSQVFEESYRAITALSSKPVELVEFGSAEAGGDKAAWIRDMCTQLPRFPRITRMTWFNEIERADFRLQSSDAAFSALAECAQSRLKS